MFVSGHLEDRIKNMDKNWKLKWQLVEFVEEPKLVDLSPLDMQNGEPVIYMQLTYKLNTIQVRILKFYCASLFY